MAGSNTAPKIKIENEGEKIKLSLIKPVNHVNNAPSLKKSKRSPKSQAQIIKQEKERARNNKDNIIPFQKREGGGKIPAGSYGNIGGEEEKNQEANTPFGSTAMNEGENEIESETQHMRMDENELVDRNENIAQDKMQEFDKEAHNEGVTRDKIQAGEGMQAGSLTQEQEQARNAAAMDSGENQKPLSNQDAENNDAEQNPKDNIQEDRNKDKNKEALDKKENSSETDLVKKIGWSMAKKWLWGIIISIAISLIPWIIATIALIIMALIAYQLAQHPVWSFIDLMLGRYGHLMEVIFDL